MSINDTARALIMAQSELSRQLFENIDEMGSTLSIDEICSRIDKISFITNALCDYVQVLRIEGESCT